MYNQKDWLAYLLSTSKTEDLCDINNSVQNVLKYENLNFSF
jgi:hypothetical protein